MKLKNMIKTREDAQFGGKLAFKEQLIMGIRKIFRSYGYRAVNVPMLEYMESIENQSSKLKLVNPQGEIMELRSDATIPVSRMVAANYKDIDYPIRLSYETEIFRIGDKSMEFEDFIQVGIESFNIASPQADAEVISLGMKVLRQCGIEDLHFDIGHASFVSTVMEKAGISAQDIPLVTEFINQKNRSELAAYLAEKDEKNQYLSILSEIPALYGKPETVLLKVRELTQDNDLLGILENLEIIWSILQMYGYSRNVTFDLGFTNTQDYYTGVIFKGYVNNYGKPLIGGGRYDRLTERFGASKPACGFGMNMNNLMEVLNMYEMMEMAELYVDYLVLYDNGKEGNGIKLSEELRTNGYIVESEKISNLTKQLEGADFRNTRFIVKVEGDSLTLIDVKKDKLTRTSQGSLLASIRRTERVVSIH